MGTRQEPWPVSTSWDVPERSRTFGARPVQAFECDACGKRFEGEPAGHGLYVWTRGDETRYEEPPLCESCANAIGLTALALWELEEDGD
jgi:hypothetical protein